MSSIDGDVFMMEQAAADMDAEARRRNAYDSDRGEDHEYWEWVDLASQEAETLQKAMRRRNTEQLRGMGIGNFLFRADKDTLNFSGGANYVTPIGSSFYLSIETPIVGKLVDLEAIAETGWIFELRADAPGAQAFYSDKDADRPEHYWVNYQNSPVYIYRVQTGEKAARELWFTVGVGNRPDVEIEPAVPDPERDERIANWQAVLHKATVAADKEFPELVAENARHDAAIIDIEEKYSEDLARWRESTSQDLLLGDGSPGVTAIQMEIAQHTINWTNQIISERGRQHNRLIQELLDREGVSHPYRPGIESLQHCVGLLRQALAELKL